MSKEQERLKKIANFCQEYSLDFQNLDLLELAFTHASYAYEQRKLVQNNERLEYLGDAVLELLVSELLFQHQSYLAEGKMTQIRASLVCEQTLAKIAMDLNFDQLLLVGRGELGSGGNHKASNLANCFEAVLAAIYLDFGLKRSQGFVQEVFEPFLQKALAGKLIYDYKSRLLEYCQAQEKIVLPEFILLKTTGPAHDRKFTMSISYKGQNLAQASAGSKKAAEQILAAKALEILDQKREFS